MIFDSTQNAGEASPLCVNERPITTMLTYELSRCMLGGKPRYDEQIGIFSERSEPSGAAMIGIAVDYRRGCDLLEGGQFDRSRITIYRS